MTSHELSSPIRPHPSLLQIILACDGEMMFMLSVVAMVIMNVYTRVWGPFKNSVVMTDDGVLQAHAVGVWSARAVLKSITWKWMIEREKETHLFLISPFDKKAQEMMYLWGFEACIFLVYSNSEPTYVLFVHKPSENSLPDMSSRKLNGWNIEGWSGCFPVGGPDMVQTSTAVCVCVEKDGWMD